MRKVKANTIRWTEQYADLIGKIEDIAHGNKRTPLASLTQTARMRLHEALRDLMCANLAAWRHAYDQAPDGNPKPPGEVVTQDQAGNTKAPVAFTVEARMNALEGKLDALIDQLGA